MAADFTEAFGMAALGVTSVIPSLLLALGVYKGEVLHKTFLGSLSTALNCVFEYVIFISRVLYLQKKFKVLAEQSLSPQ